ncbi:unnamed protein product [Blepharisma stoltei]|uniref:UBC core domain-containing protein n=1 Tax=Blepharisma stoltei TaxID=1481888 RepID=A0AAU9J2B8_9CILI|nr:unnamed protein product [Blepharisma stoltei]
MSTLEHHTLEIQKKRFEKELKLIQRIGGDFRINTSESRFGHIIRVELHDKLLTGIPYESVVFEIYLEGKFPFQPPRVICETNFGFPSVSDGRDLLLNITKKKWAPSITSLDIINALPAYIAELHQKYLLGTQTEVGTFHLGDIHNIRQWENKEGMGCFFCTELGTENNKEQNARIIVITHSKFLELEPHIEPAIMGKIVSWATLQSINTILTNKSEPNQFVIEWKQIEDTPPFRQTFRTSQTNEVLELISQNTRRLNTVAKSISLSIPLINEAEVLPDRVKKMNIFQILKLIEEAEKNLTKLITLKAIDELMNLYQQAIEYFSAVNDEQYGIFLKRMHGLLANEAIQSILQRHPDEVIENYGPLFEEEKIEEKVLLERIRTSQTIELAEIREDQENTEMLNNSREPTEGEESGHSTDSEPRD